MAIQQIEAGLTPRIQAIEHCSSWPPGYGGQITVSGAKSGIFVPIFILIGYSLKRFAVQDSWEGLVRAIRLKLTLSFLSMNCLATTAASCSPTAGLAKYHECYVFRICT